MSKEAKKTQEFKDRDDKGRQVQKVEGILETEERSSG